MKRRYCIAVIGDSNIGKSSYKYKLAEKLGAVLIDNGFRIVTGGMGGIMEAAIGGARTSQNYKEGDLVSIVPHFDPDLSHIDGDIIIPTGLDTYRNVLVANSDAVIAIGGGVGTLSEISYAWMFKRLVIAYAVEGWSGSLAGLRIDKRKRIKWEGDRVFEVKNEGEVINILNTNLSRYTKRHRGIPERSTLEQNLEELDDLINSILGTYEEELSIEFKTALSDLLNATPERSL
jgi:hypothetical protein